MPDHEATSLLMDNIAEAYAKRFGVKMFEIVWKMEDKVHGCLCWTPIGQYPQDENSEYPIRHGKYPSIHIGLFNRCQNEKIPIYVKNLKKLYKGEITEVRNEFFPERMIKKEEYYQGNPDTDEELIIPMIIKGAVLGLINLECDREIKLPKIIRKELEAISSPLAKIIEKSELDKERREVLKKKIAKLKFDDIQPLKEKPLGIYLRPFDSEFIHVENKIKELLKEYQVDFNVVESTTSETLIDEGIINQIKTCDFAIAEITGMNPNVLVEIGLLIGCGKHFSLIQNEIDKNKERPFDLDHREIHVYHVNKEETGEVTEINFKKKFVKSLDDLINKSR
ncbi:MAG: hypothetical protein WCE94_06070 [Candidatus Methanoperedens sp.]